MNEKRAHKHVFYLFIRLIRRVKVENNCSCWRNDLRDKTSEDKLIKILELNIPIWKKYAFKSNLILLKLSKFIYFSIIRWLLGHKSKVFKTSSLWCMRLGQEGRRVISRRPCWTETSRWSIGVPVQLVRRFSWIFSRQTFLRLSRCRTIEASRFELVYGIQWGSDRRRLFGMCTSQSQSIHI